MSYGFQQQPPSRCEVDITEEPGRQLVDLHRVGDFDGRCGASSIQKFDGEDLSIASRVLGQSEQCKAWWEAELARKQAEEQADEVHKQALASRVSLAHSQILSISRTNWM